MAKAKVAPQASEEEETIVSPPPVTQPKKETSVKKTKTKKASPASHDAWIAKRKKAYILSIANREKSIAKLMVLVDSRKEINKRLTQKLKALK